MLVEIILPVGLDYVLCVDPNVSFVYGLAVQSLTSLLEQHFGALQELNVIYRHVGKWRQMPLFPVLLERIG
jgi:hypothetical protein